MLAGTQTREGGEKHPTSLSTRVYRVHTGQKGLSLGARRQAAAGGESGSKHCTLTDHRPKNGVSVRPTARENTTLSLEEKSAGVYTCSTTELPLTLTTRPI